MLENYENDISRVHNLSLLSGINDFSPICHPLKWFPNGLSVTLHVARDRKIRAE